MLPGLSRNGPAVSIFALVTAAVLFLAAPSSVLAGPLAVFPAADEAPSDGADADSDNDAGQPPQRAPEADEPSEDGTDGATGDNSAEPPSGCLFRDGPLELVV
ncbi:MAG: hypothetical protein IKE66_00375 [Hyphomicrobium sp.]|nr:hypothetical protein [Hyphomicrobium sp.]